MAQLVDFSVLAQQQTRKPAVENKGLPLASGWLNLFQVDTRNEWKKATCRVLKQKKVHFSETSQRSSEVWHFTKTKSAKFTLSKKWREGFALQQISFEDQECQEEEEEEEEKGEEYFLSLGSTNLKDGTERMSRNVAKWLRNHAVQHPKRAKFPTASRLKAKTSQYLHFYSDEM